MGALVVARPGLHPSLFLKCIGPCGRPSGAQSTPTLSLKCIAHKDPRPYDTPIPLLRVEEEVGNWWSGQRNVGYRVPIVGLLAVGE